MPTTITAPTRAQTVPNSHQANRRRQRMITKTTSATMITTAAISQTGPPLSPALRKDQMPAMANTKSNPTMRSHTGPCRAAVKNEAVPKESNTTSGQIATSGRPTL